MARVTKYYCNDCGCELTEEDRLFHWDDKTNETVDYLLLMTTCSLGDGSKIKGIVGETFCPDCKRHIKIYTITQYSPEIENPCKTVMEGIENHIAKIRKKIEELRQIRERQKYNVIGDDGFIWIEFTEFEFDYDWSESEDRNEIIAEAIEEFQAQVDDKIAEYEKWASSIYLVEIDANPNIVPDHSKTVECPQCSGKISRFVDPLKPCPRCGGEILLGDSMFCD